MSIRLRLAIWYTAVLVATLVLSSLLLYLLMVQHFHEEADESVKAWAHHVASTITIPSGASTLGEVSLPPLDAFSAPGVYVQVISTAGTPIARSTNSAEVWPAATASVPGEVQGSHLVTTYLEGVESRLYTQPLVSDDRLLGFVQVLRTFEEDHATLMRLQLALLGVGGLFVVVGGLISWAVARRALQPIAHLNRSARDITGSRDHSRRISAGGAKDELGDLADTFNEMLASLEEANAAQRRFVADASHELRTPLTTVGGNLELIRKHGDRIPTPEVRELVQSACVETDRMSRLVANLLALARADTGQRMSLRSVELDRLLISVCQQTRLLGSHVGVRIEEIDQVVVEGNADGLTQLLLALLDNALKYTPEGGHVYASLRKDQEWAHVEVRDTGIGISAGDLPHIFERFYRADGARALDARGTGLGLAIALSIAREHWGDISVESQLGLGSRFVVRLPLAPRASLPC